MLFFLPFNKQVDAEGLILSQEELNRKVIAARHQRMMTERYTR